MTITYISWAANCSRSDHTARELGGRSHMIYWHSLGSRPLTVWLKYLGQAGRTWRVLRAERPDAVFVMSPPLFASLVAWIYCLTHGSALVIDAHTAAFAHPRWRYFQWLQFWLCRRAAATIVHNEPLRDLVQQHGGHAIVVTDVPVRFSAFEPYPLPDATNIAVVCSFNPDEPIANVIAAARQRPDVQFHVSGDPSALRAADRSALPANVRLTGFLSTEAYASLITHADAVLTLTTRDNTMLRGAWEAVYQGTPVIVSDWKVLRESFGSGAVYVDNTPEGIAAGIDELSRNRAHYRAETRKVRDQKERRWASVKEGLSQLIPR